MAKAILYLKYISPVIHQFDIINKYVYSINMRICVMLICFIFGIVEVTHSACPKMQKAKNYSVDGKKFQSYYAAKSYIMDLKKEEDHMRKLEVSKLTSFSYKTKWVYQTVVHGFYCVCPDCRKNLKEIRKRHSYL